MASHEDANLILKLYELRREEKMRQAREWFGAKFKPTSAQDIIDIVAGEHSAYLRMVTSYWEMAAAMVNHGTIDRDLFCETNGEQFFVYAKLEPFIQELRERVGNPKMFGHLERLTNEAPNGRESVARWQARWKAEAAAAQSASKS